MLKSDELVLIRALLDAADQVEIVRPEIVQEPDWQHLMAAAKAVEIEVGVPSADFLRRYLAQRQAMASEWELTVEMCERFKPP